MMNDWKVHPATRISPIAKNTYLVDFVSARQMHQVLQMEPWFYRSDIVAIRRVQEPSQLRPDFVGHISLWTQFHNVPPELLSAEGIYHLASKVGTPISEVKHGYNAGRLFMKVKNSYLANKKLQDSIPLEHPVLGIVTIHLVYERAARICTFCGFVGHEISGCASRARVLQLSADPANANSPELALLRKHKLGPWINCSTLVPREMPEDAPTSEASPHMSPQNSHNGDKHGSDTPPYVPIPPLNANQIQHHQTAVPTNQPANLPFLPASSQLTGANQQLPLQDPLPSNPNCASPLYCPTLNTNKGDSMHVPSSSLAYQTRNLTICDTAGRRGSSSPPPGYHKRLRAASPQSPPGEQ